MYVSSGRRPKNIFIFGPGPNYLYPPPHLSFRCGDPFFGRKNKTMFMCVLETQIGMMIAMSIMMMMTDCDDHAKNDQGPCRYHDI